jgi:hypothetical protein
MTCCGWGHFHKLGCGTALCPAVGTPSLRIPNDAINSIGTLLRPRARVDEIGQAEDFGSRQYQGAGGKERGGDSQKPVAREVPFGSQCLPNPVMGRAGLEPATKGL